MISEQEKIIINIVLDMPPGVNKLYKPVPSRDANGRLTAKIIKSDLCREWAAYAKNQVTYQRSGQTIPYRFKIKLILPEAYTDSDAPIKETIDACQHGGAITNDKHCRGGVWDIDETRPRGSMLVELTSTDDPIPPAMLRRMLNQRNQASFSL